MDNIDNTIENRKKAIKALEKSKKIERKQKKLYAKEIRGVFIISNSKERLEEYEKMLNKNSLIKV